MSIKAGSRVGPYEITSTLGEGGMGIVFRGRDASLQRDVALKLLPSRFSADPERLARFRREAQILAALNHSNIAQIYGLEQSGESNCIVMELVEGETLADRIRRGPIPLDEAMEIARQVALALEAAHEKGIVHRDLKPANVKRTPDGKVKVLDFGLAKALVEENPTVELSQSPTMMTGSVAGVILGTAPYMAPEQARGRPVDKRADIWAFGCLLYEMLVGKPAFTGTDVAEILGAVIHKQPDWDAVPPAARLLVRRCLEKDASRRLRDIGDAMTLVELDAQTPSSTSKQLSRLAWIVAAAFALVAGIVSTLYLLQAPPERAVVTFQVPAPNDTEFENNNIAVSPNGLHVAFLARGKDQISRIWVRNLDSIDAKPLAGTEGSQAPAWSPDNRYLVFGVGNQVKKVTVADGVVQTLCTSATPVGTIAWSKDDILLFGGRGEGALQQVSIAGGNPVAVTSVNSPKAVFHTFPSFLPDGRHFIYFAGGPGIINRGVYVGSLDVKPETQDSTRLLDATSNAIYVAGANPWQGHILYTTQTTLMAHPFDAKKRQLRGDPVPVAEPIAAVNPALNIFSASGNVLVYRAGAGTFRTPTVADRSGNERPLVSHPIKVENPRLSPDGQRLTLIVDNNLWVYELGGRPPIKLTSGGSPGSPLWTRDGAKLLFEANAPSELRDASGKPLDVSVSSLVSIRLDGSNSIEPASPPGHFHAMGWLPSGEVLAVNLPVGSNPDIVAFQPNATAEVKAVVKTSADEGGSGASLSSDGRWLAYSSNTTGTVEVWVKSNVQPGSPIRISPNGGVEPHWSRDGKEIFYIERDRMMSVAVDTRSGFDFKQPVPLFGGAAPPAGIQVPSYDVAPDGKFILLRSSTTTSAPITLVMNWAAKFQK
jgi:eukaryotic-like serine/threonine-protein kinase